MTEEQQKGLTRLLDRLGSALLGLKAAVESLEKRVSEDVQKLLAQGSAQLTEFALLKQAIQEARKDVDDAERAIDRLRGDLTPVRGVPLPPRADDSIELGPVKVPITVGERVVRSLPIAVLGGVIALCLIALALWLSGARVAVEEQPVHKDQTQQGDHR